jgi:pimeloyl-ACP methyl ester carboxylesterase
MPITIFHGDQDKLINHRSSVKLKQFLKPVDTLIILEGQGHNEMSDHPEFTEALKTILTKT